MFYDGTKWVVGVLRVCIFCCGMVRKVEELRWYFLRFFLHCVLSFVGGFGNGHDRRGR